MKILIFGGSGGMGSLCSAILQERNYRTQALSSNDVDIRNEEEVAKAIQVFQPDIVLNFAVYNSDGAVHKLHSEEVEKQIDVNIKGALHIMKSSLQEMRPKKFGRIIFISSVLSTNPVFGTALYSAGKGFVDSLVKTSAVENTAHGITVNSIQLGYFEAGLIKKVPEKLLEQVIEKIPLKRLGKADELVNAIEFMIKTEYFTGMNLPLAGGLNVSSL